MQEYDNNFYRFVNKIEAGIKAIIATMQGAIDNISSTVTALAAQVGNIVTNLSTLANTVNSQSSSITTLRTDVDTLQANTPPLGGYNRALLESYGAAFNEETGYYEMNEIYDLTEKDMNVIVANSTVNAAFGSGTIYYGVSKPRTFPILGQRPGDFATAFGNCVGVEKINLSSMNEYYYSNINTSCFFNCNRLTKVITIMNNSGGTKPIKIGNAKRLEYIKIKNIHTDASISKCPVLSLESLTYWVDNANNTTAVTWSVHESIYAKMIDEADTEGWHDLYIAAQAKNIAFATVTEAATMALLDEAPEIQIEEIGDKMYMLAPAGYYITSADDSVELQHRLFVTHRILLDGETVADWRLATAAEVEEQRQEIMKDMPPMVEESEDEEEQKA